MRRSVLSAVVVAAAVTVAGYLPAASAADAAPSTPLYLHSAGGGYLADFAADPGLGRTPAGSTLSADAPTRPNAATATASSVLADTALFSIPVTGAVTSACVDIWAAPVARGALSGNTTGLWLSFVRPGLGPVDLGGLQAAYAGGISRVSGLLPVPEGIEVPPGSSLQITSGLFQDPTDVYYDSVDMPSSVTFNATSCAGQPVAQP